MLNHTYIEIILLMFSLFVVLLLFVLLCRATKLTVNTFRQLLQIMHNSNPVRDIDGDNDVTYWSGSVLRNDVPRLFTRRYHVRPCVPSKAFVDRSDSNDLRDYRSINGSTRLYDTLRWFSSDGSDKTQSLPRLGIKSWRTDIMCCLHGCHLHAKDSLDCHSLLP